MDINPDFRTQLRMLSGGDDQRFELVPAGAHWLSIQCPDHKSPNFSPTRALEDCDYWHVGVFTTDSTASTPLTDPRIFRDALWRQYWTDGLFASRLPTEVVQTLYDFLVLGPERYEEMTKMHQEFIGWMELIDRRSSMGRSSRLRTGEKAGCRNEPATTATSPGGTHVPHPDLPGEARS